MISLNNSVLRHLRLAAGLGQQLHELCELALVFRAHRSELLDHLGPRRERRLSRRPHCIVQ